MRPARRAGEESICVFVRLDPAIKWVGLGGGAKKSKRFGVFRWWAVDDQNSDRTIGTRYLCSVTFQH